MTGCCDEKEEKIKKLEEEVAAYKIILTHLQTESIIDINNISQINRAASEKALNIRSASLNPLKYVKDVLGNVIPGAGNQENREAVSP